MGTVVNVPVVYLRVSCVCFLREASGKLIDFNTTFNVFSQQMSQKQMVRMPIIYSSNYIIRDS